MSRPFGATTGATQADAGWTFAYDEMGRITSVSPPGESVRAIVYDRLKATEFVAGVEKAYRVDDGLGHIVLSVAIEPTSPAPNHEIQTRLSYGPFALLHQIFQPGAAVTTALYDHLGRRTRISDPDSGTLITHWNSFGEVEREELPGQADVVYERDLIGRPVTVTSGDGVTSYQWDTAANGIGKVESESSPFGVTARRSYRPDGLLASTAWNVAGADFAFDWSYDSSGRAAGLTYPSIGGPSRFGVSLSYGADGQIASISPASGGAPFWSKSAVADDGHLFTESFGDGLGGIRDTDPITGRVAHIATGSGTIVPDSGGGQTFTNAVQSLRYQYYPDGNLSSRTDVLLGATETFAYDNLDRITDWTVSSLQSHITYGYDDTGNLISRRESNSAGTTLALYGYGGSGAGPHALTSGPSGATYAYDSAGRQTVRPGQPLLAYTSFDLPTQIQRASGGSVNFAYNADGRRVRKVSATSDVITLEGLYERRIENGTTTHVLYLPGGVGQVGCNSTGVCTVPIFFHQDRLGTIDTVTANGAVLGRQKRDPFGRAYSPATFSDPSAAVSLSFLGQAEDRETGLVDLQHRLYDPNLGRFISPDPFVKSPLDGQSFNRFSYAANNPLAFVDPSGLQAVDVEDVPAPSTDVSSGPGVDQLVDKDAQTGDGYTRDGGTIRFDPIIINGDRPPTSDRGDGSRVTQVLDLEVPSAGPAFAGSMLSPTSVPDPTGLGALDAVRFGPGSAEIVRGVPNVGDVDSSRVLATIVGPSKQPGESEEAYRSRVDLWRLMVDPSLSVGGVAGISTRGGLLAAQAAGMAAIRLIGQQGERLAGIAKNAQRIPALISSAAYRVPDMLVPMSRYMAEVKNVSYQALTSQMQDFIAYASSRGYTFDLLVREGTQLSSPLLEAESQGLVNILRILP